MRVHEHSRNLVSDPRKGGASRRWRGLAGRALALAALGFAMVAAPAASRPASVGAATTPFGAWRAPLHRDHPLVGRIIDARSMRPISPAALRERVKRARILILGEVHDNPDHHRIQADLLRVFAAGKGGPPKVVYEMIPTDKAGVLSALRGAKRLKAGAVFDIVDWEHSGWPSRALYRPVMEATVAISGLPVPGGVPKSLVRKVSRRGLAALTRQRIGILALGPLDPVRQKALEREIVKSHCDMIPAEAAKAMSAVQRLRDATLAFAVVKAFEKAGAVAVIAGDGHARKDCGVPLYLKRQRHGYFRQKRDLPDPLVIWMAEVDGKARSLKDLLPKGVSPLELADIFIITPRARREDPCAQFRRFMERKKNEAREQRSGEPEKGPKPAR